MGSGLSWILNQNKLMSQYTCMDCKIDTAQIQEYYMVDDTLWDTINPKILGMLCIGCLEDRIGRLLTPEDFTICPVNDGCFGRSSRMLDRLGIYETISSPTKVS